MYERATTGVLNKNLLLYFSYADFEEGRMKYEKVHTIYQKILDIEDVDPTLVCNITLSYQYYYYCWWVLCHCCKTHNESLNEMVSMSLLNLKSLVAFLSQFPLRYNNKIQTEAHHLGNPKSFCSLSFFNFLFFWSVSVYGLYLI